MLVFPNLTPSEREQAKQILKDAFAEGRLIHGIADAGVRGRGYVGCAMGQIRVAAPTVFQKIGPTGSFVVMRTNDQECGTQEFGRRLETIEPLLRLFDAG